MNLQLIFLADNWCAMNNEECMRRECVSNSTNFRSSFRWTINIRTFPFVQGVVSFNPSLIARTSRVFWRIYAFSLLGFVNKKVLWCSPRDAPIIRLESAIPLMALLLIMGNSISYTSSSDDNASKCVDLEERIYN